MPEQDPNVPRQPTGGDARERWNRRWAGRGVPALTRPPARWLAENRDLLTVATPGGRALDVACGDGRNAAFLAQLGFAVDAVDISDVAIDAIAGAAAERGLAITARQSDLEQDPLPDGPYDAITVFNYLQRDLFAALEAALSPGGILVYETFTAAHARELGHAVDERYLLAPGELGGAFPSLAVLRHREGIDERGDRPRAVASLVARRSQ
ncbi:MAG TPA: class I SAM-dependent methyltransferase [Solirubrobacteraceae bacterium]|jgi:SAM-dependent methyltransferase|nr:class I SAM-dependent methyltransferase [Solirubrobacteraceae bacterium]